MDKTLPIIVGKLASLAIKSLKLGSGATWPGEIALRLNHKLLNDLVSSDKQVILVAGFFKPLNPPEPELMVQDGYDWGKIKSRVEKFTFINSDNDPWGCTDQVGKEMQEKLGGELIVPKGEGHMGSTTFNQPYREFPLLLKLIV